MSGSQLLLLGGAQVVSDPNFEYTTLLLPGNGTNGAQNNTFLDSSTNNFTITRNGNTTQGTFSPFSQTGWGNFFDGSGDFLSVASSAAFDIGSSDFTVECWFNANSFATAFGLISRYDNAPAGWTLRVTSATNIRFVRGADIIFDATTTMSVGVWNHVAVVRSGTTLSIYHNGTRINQTTGISNFTDASTALQIGRTNTLTDDINGYISNARVVKGTAVYSGATYTIPTAPLTAITNTSLLTCQSNRFIDNSSNAFAITRNGDVSVQAFSPFNPTAAWSAATYGGSGYFDGSGDFLTVPDNSALEFGNSTLTLELWINTTATAQYTTLASRETTGFSSGMWALQVNGSGANSGDITFFAADFSVSTPLLQSTGSKVNDSAWHHVAVVRNVNSWTLYIDGVSRSTATWSGTVADIAGAFYIGASQAFGRNYSGYMTDLRLIKGTAVYTAAFTPPTAPLTAITNTSLLLNYTNAGIYDATSKNDLETVGNAQISTTQSKFGGSSIYFNNNNANRVKPPASQNFAFGTGDFTVEAWVYVVSLTPENFVFDTRSGVSTSGMGFSIEPTTGKLRYSGSANNVLTSSAVSTGVWTHVAWTRYNGTLRGFINGVLGGSAANTDNLTMTNGEVGNVPFSNVASNLYINDLRITKGIARYTSNFTPPTTAFPLL